MAYAVWVLMTLQPTPDGRPPGLTSRFVMALICIFSAPWGYLTFSGTISTPYCAGFLDRSRSMASCLFFSMP